MIYLYIKECNGMKLHIKLILIYALVFIVTLAVIVFSDLKAFKALEKNVLIGIQRAGESVHNSTRRMVLQGLDRSSADDLGLDWVSPLLLPEKEKTEEENTLLKDPSEGWEKNILVREVLKFRAFNPDQPRIQYEICIPMIKNKKLADQFQTTTFEIDDFKQLLSRTLIRHLLISSLCLIAGMLIIYLLIRHFNRPLARLTEAAEEVSKGNFSVEVQAEDKDEIGALSRTFNMMAGKISEHRQMESKIQELERKSLLSEISASLAHEVRNPLNLINLTADHLLTQYAPEDPAKKEGYQEFVHSLKVQVEHLNRMVEAMLTMGKPPKLQSMVFKLNDLLEEIYILMRHKLESRKIQIEFPSKENYSFYGDSEQLRLVFLNLILNAVQAMQKNGKIFIRIEKRLNERVMLLYVRDTGPGIPEENFIKIFDPYFTTRPDGTGLGLALVRRIVEEHDGRIFARNHEEGGAEFILQFPLERMRA